MRTATRVPAISSPLPSRTPRSDRRTTIAGALLGFTGIGIVMSILTNEAVYPAARHYSTFANTISDLGGTVPPNSYMVQPNRLIFITTMALAGAMVLAATALLWRNLRPRRIVVGLGIFGAALVGIAVFPGNVAIWHPLFALTCFVAGGVTAIMSRRIFTGPARFFAVGLGTIALAATAAGLDPFANWWPQATIGIGGVERWIAYPVLLWMVLLGAALMTVGAHSRIRA